MYYVILIIYAPGITIMWGKEQGGMHVEARQGGMRFEARQGGMRFEARHVVTLSWKDPWNFEISYILT